MSGARRPRSEHPRTPKGGARVDPALVVALRRDMSEDGELDLAAELAAVQALAADLEDELEEARDRARDPATSGGGGGGVSPRKLWEEFCLVLTWPLIALRRIATRLNRALSPLTRGR